MSLMGYQPRSRILRTPWVIGFLARESAGLDKKRRINRDICLSLQSRFFFHKTQIKENRFIVAKPISTITQNLVFESHFLLP
jgi:hypothetical protein